MASNTVTEDASRLPLRVIKTGGICKLVRSATASSPFEAGFLRFAIYELLRWPRPLLCQASELASMADARVRRVPAALMRAGHASRRISASSSAGSAAAWERKGVVRDSTSRLCERSLAHAS